MMARFGLALVRVFSLRVVLIGGFWGIVEGGKQMKIGARSGGLMHPRK